MNSPSIEIIFKSMLDWQFLGFLAGTALGVLLFACVHRFFQQVQLSIEREIAQRENQGEIVLVQLMDAVGAGLAHMALLVLRFVLPFLALWLAVRLKLLSSSMEAALMQGMVILYVGLKTSNWSFYHIVIPMKEFDEKMSRARCRGEWVQINRLQVQARWLSLRAVFFFGGFL